VAQTQKLLYKRKLVAYGTGMKTLLRSNLVSPIIGALIWIVVSLATGASLVFAFVGGILCLIVIYACQEAYRRLFLTGRRAP